MTQTAIGAASVGMALWLFVQQAQLQNARQFSQQANVTAAVLRSIIVAVTRDIKDIPPLNRRAYLLDCDTISQCNFDASDSIYSAQLHAFRNFIQTREDQRPVFELVNEYSDQVREAMKTSYVLGPRVMDYLLSTAQSYSNSIRRTRRSIVEHGPQVKSLLSGAEISPRDVSNAFLKMAAIQAENILEAAHFVCALDTIERLLTSTKSREGADLLVDVPSGDNDFYMCNINGGEAFDPYLEWDKRFRKVQN
jgi:hypothetical protein